MKSCSRLLLAIATLVTALVGCSSPTGSNASTSNSTSTTTPTFTSSDSYGTLPSTTFYPVTGSTGAYTDGELEITFAGTPTLNSGGYIEILNTSGTVIDTIKFAGETQTPVNGTAVTVGSQLARVSGNSVYFTPHYNKLANSTTYYVAIPTAAITATLNGYTFAGLSNATTAQTWAFTTRAAPTVGTTITVDNTQGDTPTFRTLSGAFNYLAGLTTLPGTAITINVTAGTYYDMPYYIPTVTGTGYTITVAGPSTNVVSSSMITASALSTTPSYANSTCTIQYTNGNSINASTKTRAVMYFKGANLVLQNIAIVNTGVRSSVAQAEALYFGAGTGYTLAAGNCWFKSYQDTLQTSGRNWFYNCSIEGNVDFIWGIADAALFQNDYLHVIYDGGSSYNLVVARTATAAATTVGKGYVIADCAINTDASDVVYYGRDAGYGTGDPWDQVALINNYFYGSGTLGSGLWTITTTPLHVGDGSAIGWKAAGNTGLTASTATTATGTASYIDSQTTQWADRDLVLNDVILPNSQTTTASYCTYETLATAGGTAWDTSALATAWSAPSTTATF